MWRREEALGTRLYWDRFTNSVVTIYDNIIHDIHHVLFLTSGRARWIHYIAFLCISCRGMQCSVFILPSLTSKITRDEYHELVSIHCMFFGLIYVLYQVLMPFIRLYVCSFWLVVFSLFSAKKCPLVCYETEINQSKCLIISQQSVILQKK